MAKKASLNEEQREDAARLYGLFAAWQQRKREAGTPVSQEEAAAQLGMGQSAFNQYINGWIPLNGEAVLKFARLLGAKPSEISRAVVRAEVERAMQWMAIAMDSMGELWCDEARLLAREVQALPPGQRRRAYAKAMEAIQDILDDPPLQIVPPAA